MTPNGYLPAIELSAELERKLLLAFRAELGFPDHSWHSLSAIPEGFTARVARRFGLALLNNTSEADMLADVERAADLYHAFFDAIRARQAANQTYQLTGKKAEATAALLAGLDLTNLKL